MVNKKGFIRTLEAIIAILMIFGIIYFLLPKNIEVEEKAPKIVESSQDFILREVLYNNVLKNCLMNLTLPQECNKGINCGFNDFIKKNLPVGYDYECEICNGPLSCMQKELPKDKAVYVDSVFLAAEKLDQESRVVRIYFWEK